MDVAFVTRFARDDRGQAIVETALFTPLLLLAMLATIFFVRLGVLSERAETAVRYGDLVSFRNGSAYSASAVGYLLQQAVYGNNPTQLLDLCLVPASGTATPNPMPTGVNGDIRAALYQQQIVNPSATATPVPAQAFFQADGITQPNCAPGTVNLAGSSPTTNGTTAYPVGNLPVSVDTFSITAKVGTNAFISPLVMGNGCTLASGNACSSTTANMAFINVATPTTLITCVQGLSVVLKILNPAAASNLPICST